jgi:DeoR/GlpR family transcriptional regulator of sugar metabolism
MKTIDRHVLIIKTLHIKGSLTLKELSAEIKWSTDTVRSDILYLVSKNKVYYRTNSTNNKYIVLIATNCKSELYERISVADWIKSNKV